MKTKSKGIGLVKGYEPNRLSFYILCLHTGRLDDLNKALWEDMEKYKITEKSDVPARD